MRMKKIRLLATLIAIVSCIAILISCSSEDVKKPGVGTWVLIETTEVYKENGEVTGEFRKTFAAIDRVDKMIFNANETGTVIFEDEMLNVDWWLTENWVSNNWISIRTECLSFRRHFILVNSVTLVWRKTYRYITVLDGVVNTQETRIEKTWTRI